jgi:hypothetical protein
MSQCYYSRTRRRRQQPACALDAASLAVLRAEGFAGASCSGITPDEIRALRAVLTGDRRAAR